MFRQPKHKYSAQLINVWVDKPWCLQGNRIPCRLELCSTESKIKKNLIIYSHGHAENILDCLPFIQQIAQSTENDVLIYEYSGYGLATANSFERSESGVNLTLQTIVETMNIKHGYAMKDISLWGYSLGSGPSLYVANRLNADGKHFRALILLGAYSSILELISDHIHQKVSELFKPVWNNRRMISNVSVPTLILHGQNDRTVNMNHAIKLKNACAQAKLVVMPNVDHNTFKWVECSNEVQTWLQTNNY
jgi:pimeloyl-ACP methyl ester carboxylesterase